LNWTDDFGFLINKAARLSKWEVNKKLSELNVTFPQWVVIKYLYENERNKIDDSCFTHSPATIAEKLRYDRPTMTGIIDRLVKQGWVLRINNPSDRRSQSITLTDKSKKFIQKMDNVCEEINNKTLDGLQGSEITDLKNYLLRIINNLDKHYPDIDGTCLDLVI
jgi:DNA-binding MarR family transcriptional regulator